MRKKDLVVLSYSDNNLYTKVAEFKDEKIDGLEVDVDKMVWSYCFGDYSKLEDIPIGSCRNFYGSHGESSRGVIGVYDKTNMEHLNSMNYDAKWATRERNWSVDD